jgi:hypothetical protein
MLINPFETRVLAHQGTRILQADLGILGAEVYDPQEPTRPWYIESLFSPVPGRAIGGIRAKLIDEKGFVSFINQRDLEVSIGMAAPGAWCKWLGQPYVDADDDKWIGICADDEDLLDDLLEREMVLRGASPNGVLYSPLDIERRVHLEARNDFEDTYTLLWDMDPDTGYGPDPRFATIERRWARVERRRVLWDRI